MSRLLPLRTSLPIAALCLTLTACGGTDDASTKQPDAASNATEASPDQTSSPTTPSTTATTESASASTPTTPEPVDLDAKDLLVQRDEGGTRPWEEEGADTPDPPAYSSKPACSKLVSTVFAIDDDKNEAAVGWFDAKTNAVTDSSQVVRVYATEAEASDALAALRSTTKKCATWRDGFERPGGWIYSLNTWKVHAFIKTSHSWRVRTGIDGVDTTSSAWLIAAQYNNVLSVVSSVANDDVAPKAQRDARSFADQAGRLILKAQGY